MLVCFTHEYYNYGLNGRCNKSDIHSSFIYKPKKVKYLKSIKQLLEEFPDAEFNALGSLTCLVWGNCISSGMLRSCGKPFKDRNLDYSYVDEWIEEREEG